MNKPLIAALIALTSTIDPKVHLEFKSPAPGTNAWPSVAFNQYCYDPSGNDRTRTETRTRAMLDIMGQAARVLAEKDQAGTFSMRTYYKDAKGTTHSSLAISIAPTSAETSSTRDINAELADAVTKAVSLGIDLSTVPQVIASQPGAFLGFIDGLIAKAGTAAANADMTNGAPASEAPEL